MSVFTWVAVVLLTVSIFLMAGLIRAVRICLELTLEQQTEITSAEHRSTAVALDCTAAAPLQAFIDLIEANNW